MGPWEHDLLSVHSCHSVSVQITIGVLTGCTLRLIASQTVYGLIQKPCYQWVVFKQSLFVKLEYAWKMLKGMKFVLKICTVMLLAGATMSPSILYWLNEAGFSNRISITGHMKLFWASDQWSGNSKENVNFNPFNTDDYHLGKITLRDQDKGMPINSITFLCQYNILKH